MSSANCIARTSASRSFVQRLKLVKKLEVHNGCVNTICWNENGSRILSGSDDFCLVISDPLKGKVDCTIRSGHRSNILSAQFLPGSSDEEIVSCSGDGCIFYTMVEREDMYRKMCFNCHVGTAYKLAVIPTEPCTFLSCGQDGTLRCFDLRVKTSCSRNNCKEDVLVDCRNPVTAVSVDHLLPYQLSVGCGDGSVRVYDRRVLGTRQSCTFNREHLTGLLSRFSPETRPDNCRITSVNYCPFSHDLLASYSADKIFLLNTQMHTVKELSIGNQNKEQSGAGNDGLCEIYEAGSERKFVAKHVRLRGDWSDTGPTARPQKDRTSTTSSTDSIREEHFAYSISDMMLRWCSMNLLSPDERVSRQATDMDAVGCNVSQAESTPAYVAHTSVRPSDASGTNTAEGSVPGHAIDQGGFALRKKCESLVFSDNSCRHGVQGDVRTPDELTMPENVDNRTRNESRIPDVKQDHLKDFSCSGTKNMMMKDLCISGRQRDDVFQGVCSAEVTAPAVAAAVTSVGSTCQIDSCKGVEIESVSLPKSSSGCQMYSDKRDVDQMSQRMRSNYSVGQTIHSSKMESSTKDDILSLKDNVEDRVEVTEDAFLKVSGTYFLVEDHSPSQQTGSSLCVQREGDASASTVTSSHQTSYQHGWGEIISGLTTNLEDNTTTPDPASSDKASPQSSTCSTTVQFLQKPMCNRGSASGATTSYNRSMMPHDAGSTTRRRRMGHSGPPTGDFQLPLNDYDGNNDEESDSDGANLGSQCERHKAAKCVQSCFRRHVKRHEQLSLSTVPQLQSLATYTGHRNSRTMIKECNFWGRQFAMSGSDCGHIFFWDLHTAELLMMLEADRHVVNCLQPHPSDLVLASSGIDYDVKIWSALESEASFDAELAEEVVTRNRIMLEETDGTITVPADFMLRVMSSIRRIRVNRISSDAGVINTDS